MRVEGEKKSVLVVGWCGCECDGVFLQQLSMSAHPPIPHAHLFLGFCLTFPIKRCECFV